jgi:lipopolysaccharide/colanic/teichoic acid biosynthesis glycosyltransferase
MLPDDRPANVSVRLMVRPGITGWAQVNGGTLCHLLFISRNDFRTIHNCVCFEEFARLRIF